MIVNIHGWMAEWSKALVLGTSPPGRGFESHFSQYFFNFGILINCSGIKAKVNISFRLAQENTQEC